MSSIEDHFKDLSPTAAMRELLRILEGRPREHHGDGDEALPVNLDTFEQRHAKAVETREKAESGPYGWPTPPAISPADAAELARMWYRTRASIQRVYIAKALKAARWPFDGDGAPLRPTADEC